MDFENGTLDVPEGTTLRTYLSKVLNCDPMRITKKYTGNSSIGKRTFTPLIRSPENVPFIDMSQRDLLELRRAWVSKLLLAEQWNNRKMNMLKSGSKGGNGAALYRDGEGNKEDYGYMSDSQGANKTYPSGNNENLEFETDTQMKAREEKISNVLKPYLSDPADVEYILNWLKTSCYALNHSTSISELDHLIQIGEISVPALYKLMLSENFLNQKIKGNSSSGNNVTTSVSDSSPSQNNNPVDSVRATSPTQNTNEQNLQFEQLHNMIQTYIHQVSQNMQRLENEKRKTSENVESSDEEKEKNIKIVKEEQREQETSSPTENSSEHKTVASTDSKTSMSIPPNVQKNIANLMNNLINASKQQALQSATLTSTSSSESMDKVIVKSNTHKHHLDGSNHSNEIEDEPKLKKSPQGSKLVSPSLTSQNNNNSAVLHDNHTLSGNKQQYAQFANKKRKKEGHQEPSNQENFVNYYQGFPGFLPQQNNPAAAAAVLAAAASNKHNQASSPSTNPLNASNPNMFMHPNMYQEYLQMMYLQNQGLLPPQAAAAAAAGSNNRQQSNIPPMMYPYPGLEGFPMGDYRYPPGYFPPGYDYIRMLNATNPNANKLYSYPWPAPRSNDSNDSNNEDKHNTQGVNSSSANRNFPGSMVPMDYLSNPYGLSLDKYLTLLNNQKLQQSLGPSAGNNKVNNLFNLTSLNHPKEDSHDNSGNKQHSSSKSHKHSSEPVKSPLLSPKHSSTASHLHEDPKDKNVRSSFPPLTESSKTDGHHSGPPQLQKSSHDNNPNTTPTPNSSIESAAEALLDLFQKK